MLHFAVALFLAVSTPASDALAHLRDLAGHWSGTVKWTGVRTDSGSMDATYFVTGNGSAVVENLGTEGTPAMTSVYHLDGADLRMTHYCGAQNQPRLKASRIDPNGIIDFEFVDATNLKAPDAPHVHGMQMNLIDANHITIDFRFIAPKGESVEHIDLRRVASPRKSD